ncbi:sensor histidine kinase [Ramlibacter sp. PS4R-6]|uniref:sensor histidine kinase n=1 Tax=Ramlibacter sp. PS4R-6 TaxID=3133438 RepID=UPI0030A3B486
MAAVPTPVPPAPTDDPVPEHFPQILGWPRLRVVFIMALGFALVHLDSPTPFVVWLARCLVVATFATIAYGVFERWPQRLPSWAARWWLQIVGVMLAGSFGAVFAYALPAGGNLAEVLEEPGYRAGMWSLILPCVVFAPPVAFAAIMRRREALARDEAMRLQLERSEIERQSADTRLRLLQGQVQPHFLFNTLANIRALVNAGSPRAVQVMDSLIAYLRASVPRLQQSEGTIAQELDLVRAYLELMHMRMPDRLHYAVESDAAANGMRCPPMALLTLVENAVRHGVDPSEDGGRIDVEVRLQDGRCIATVSDTGVGLKQAGSGGSGLANLRERMKLAFGDAQLRLASGDARGTRAVLEFPAQGAP